MKSYKINQAIERSLFPIREDLSELRQDITDGSLRAKHYINQIIQMTLPPIISVILTGIVSNPISKLLKCEGNNQSDSVFSFILRLAIVTATFIVIAAIVWLLIRFFAGKTKSDEKSNTTSRNELTDFFYRIVLPEVITSESLLNKAKEIDVENIESKNQDTEKKDSDLNDLYYYEALYHFNVVYRHLRMKNIIEYSESDRYQYTEFIDQVKYEAIRKTISICKNGTKDISNKLNDSTASKLYSDFTLLLNQLSSYRKNGQGINS